MRQPIALSFGEPVVTPLERAGVALYGADGWKAPMARDLGVNLRNFRRWADGEYPVPDPMWPLIRKLLLAHSLSCRDIAVDLPTGSGRTHDGLPQDFGAGDV